MESGTNSPMISVKSAQISGPYLAGIDIGTTGVKALIFDLTGSTIASA
jgi:predicted NBD/HSP70 family sugar kinase